jgi:nitrogen fixation protein FixH
MSERVELVSPNYYAESLTHDERQAAAARTIGLGEAFRIERGEGIVTIAWPPTAIPERGRVTLYRPADSAADRSIALAPAESGTQVIRLATLPAGAWVLQCEWVTNGLTYYAEQRVNVR